MPELAEFQTLPLREWQPQTFALTAEQVLELQACGAKVTVEPAGGTSYRVTPSSVVGSVTTEHLHVVIEPKFVIDRLFYLLVTGRRLKQLPKVSSLRQRDELTEGFVRLYLNVLQPTLRRGLLKGYRVEQESAQTVHGRIRSADQLRRRFGLPLPVEVEFDNYTEDIAENRIIKASLRRLERLRLDSFELSRRIGASVGAMELVSDQRMTHHNLPVVRFTRLNRHYELALELAGLIIENTEFDFKDGEKRVSGLLFDMNKVFEDFLYESLARRLPTLLGSHRLGTNWRWLQGAKLQLDDEGVLQPEPDLSLWSGNECLFVGDAKYKLTDDGNIDDLYQLFSYCAAAGLSEGLLIYAQQPKGPVAHQIVRGGPLLTVAAIDVTKPVTQIEARLDELAKIVSARVRSSLSVVQSVAA